MDGWMDDSRREGELGDVSFVRSFLFLFLSLLLLGFLFQLLLLLPLPLLLLSLLLREKSGTY